jgi:hypothetical protein
MRTAVPSAPQGIPYMVPLPPSCGTLIILLLLLMPTDDQCQRPLLKSNFWRSQRQMSASSALFGRPAPPALTQEQLREEPGAKVGFHRLGCRALARRNIGRSWPRKCQLPYVAAAEHRQGAISGGAGIRRREMVLQGGGMVSRNLNIF